MKPSYTNSLVQELIKLFKLASIYQSTNVKLEVERLFCLPEGVEKFLQGIGKIFEIVDIRMQRDEFWDDSDCRLADIDAYLRFRREMRGDEFLSAEIKVAYPGAASNANIRPAFDANLDEFSLAEWRELSQRLNLSIERIYEKKRVKCKSIELFRGYSVELEIDEFHEGGSLRGNSFVGFSVEVLGANREKAEASLGEAIKAVKSAATLIDCGRLNYEDLYYGRAPIPRM